MNTSADLLRDLIERVVLKWPFDPKTYPGLARLTTEEERFRFFLGHTAHHFAKTAGKIATEAEHVEHGKLVDADKLREDVIHGLVNVLRLASIIDMSAEQILTEFSKTHPELPAP